MHSTPFEEDFEIGKRLGADDGLILLAQRPELKAAQHELITTTGVNVQNAFNFHGDCTIWQLDCTGVQADMDIAGLLRCSSGVKFAVRIATALLSASVRHTKQMQPASKGPTGRPGHLRDLGAFTHRTISIPLQK